MSASKGRGPASLCCQEPPLPSRQISYLSTLLSSGFICPTRELQGARSSQKCRPRVRRKQVGTIRQRSRCVCVCGVGGLFLMSGPPLSPRQAGRRHLEIVGTQSLQSLGGSTESSLHHQWSFQHQQSHLGEGQGVDSVLSWL